MRSVKPERTLKSSSNLPRKAFKLKLDSLYSLYLSGLSLLNPSSPESTLTMGPTESFEDSNGNLDAEIMKKLVEKMTQIRDGSYEADDDESEWDPNDLSKWVKVFMVFVEYEYSHFQFSGVGAERETTAV